MSPNNPSRQSDGNKGSHLYMASRRQSVKVLKKSDGEPLTRADIQFALLSNIFSDQHQVFTDPNPTLDGRPANSQVSFRDLYVNAIIHSPKSPKALKDKMVIDHIFATDYAMICLLANVGRINTTMSFFPEMKTAIRTYHPVPALQRTAGSLQDAPRHKAILKASMLHSEFVSLNSPSTPSEVLERAIAGVIPPTGITNLLFILSNHSVAIGAKHFSSELEFLDLFTPVEFSSASRARVFLWLCYHYYQAPPSENEDDYDNYSGTENPFCDPQRPGKYPPLETLTSEEAEAENADPEDEKQHGERLVAQRAQIQKNQGANKEKGAGKSSNLADEEESVISVESATSKTPRGAKDSKKSKLSRQVMEERVKSDMDVHSRDEPYIPPPPAHSSSHVHHLEPSQLRAVQPPSASKPPVVVGSEHGRMGHTQTHSVRYTPYRPPPPTKSWRPPARLTFDHASDPPRSILQHTWHVINTTDPFEESDDDTVDEHYRQDYMKRLRVMSRLRGKDPTPEPELPRV
ncbi:hypothetical protein Moror_153 [Moniliophthora roreri MCA 2997]|uniref:Ino eighty subunit 1 n=1 Tax=Moniliophthora roreri (strain MCA 2997) TaxID=1381753 RepID=V2XGR8_MONRO|nr:hypothetical protein Moror_153 [Moniliophthora roreri MCA 2997]